MTPTHYTVTDKTGGDAYHFTLGEASADYNARQDAGRKPKLLAHMMDGRTITVEA